MCRNTVAIHSVFKKNYKTKFSTSSILKKIKSIKTILNKKHKKMGKKKEENNFGKKAKKIKKKHVGKSTIVIINQLNIQNNSTKIILKKNMWGNTVEKQKLCGEIL